MVTRKLTEKQFQGSVVQMLQILGYTVFETGKARTQILCPKCKTRHYATGWQGNTIGVPDLYVHNQHWKIPVGVGIELKTPKGEVRLKQQLYANMNVTVICRTMDEVLNAMHSIELQIGNDATLKKLESFIQNEFRQR
jgi:hypothetical protein